MTIPDLIAIERMHDALRDAIRALEAQTSRQHVQVWHADKLEALAEADALAERLNA